MFDALADTLSCTFRFYFIGIVWQPRKWWQFEGQWIDTSEVWQPESGEFEVIDYMEGGS